jgi:histone-lysine N-methyltransferase SETMAR
VARVAVSKEESVTGTFYRDHVLTATVNHYITKNPKIGMRIIKLHHDNAHAHRQAFVQVNLEEQRMEVLLHPAYSPDLSPCDFWLNPYINHDFAVAGSKTVGPSLPVYKWYTQITTQNALSEWILWFEKCVAVLRW